MRCTFCSCCANAAHPRSRGEHAGLALPGILSGGSSPLARGTCPRDIAQPDVPRLIPARAGNITPKTPFPRLRAAHPRSRGEHFSVVVMTDPGAGSSPLARGTCPPRFVPDKAVRLIPARAGNMRLPDRRGSEPTAHPRSRGEHQRRRWRAGAGDGSSPLARGT